MAAYKISSDTLTAIADAIRSKTGKTAALTLDQMPTEIDGIETGGSGGPLQAKTAYHSHSEQIIAPDEDYYGLVSVTVKPVPKLKTAEARFFEGVEGFKTAIEIGTGAALYEKTE